MDDDIDIEDLVDKGYSYEEIVEEMIEAGYDSDDINEAFVDLGYDWQDALEDAIRDQLIDLDDAAYYADLLDMNESEIYDMYFDYGDD